MQLIPKETAGTLKVTHPLSKSLKLPHKEQTLNIAYSIAKVKVQLRMPIQVTELATPTSKIAW